MKVLAVIPARLGSTRLPQKPLALINGKPLIEWVIQGSLSSQRINHLCVATDSELVAQAIKSTGVEVVMTSDQIPTGTDRIWDVAQERDQYTHVINIQGDEPLVTGSLLDQLIQAFDQAEVQKRPVQMATLARPSISSDFDSLNTVKVVLNQHQEALYFSRYNIPYSRMTPGDMLKTQSTPACLTHIGLYAYQYQMLKEFCAHPPIPLEKYESLEQLRALYLGARIKVVEVNHMCWGVDTPDDIIRVEQILNQKQNSSSFTSASGRSHA